MGTAINFIRTDQSMRHPIKSDCEFGSFEDAIDIYFRSSLAIVARDFEPRRLLPLPSRVLLLSPAGGEGINIDDR